MPPNISSQKGPKPLLVQIPNLGRIPTSVHDPISVRTWGPFERLIAHCDCLCLGQPVLQMSVHMVHLFESLTGYSRCRRREL